jgi:cytochrome P450
VPTSNEVPVCPAGFDHHTAPDDQHIWDACAELRESCRVGWSERYDGHWVASRYDEVKRVLRDFRDFSSARRDPEVTAQMLPPRRFPLSIPGEIDPPDNQRYRRRLNKILSPEPVRAMEPMIRRWTTHFIDRIADAGSGDLAFDLAGPIPASISLEWLGMPQDVADRAMNAYHEYLGFEHGHPRAEKAYEDVVWLNERILEELELRKEDPRDDILSWLLQDEDEDGRLTFKEVYEMSKILMAAGIDTTTTGLAWGLWHFAEHPDQADEMRSRPELWDTAVEEILRRYPPVTSFARTARHDLDLAGCPVRAGDKVLALMASGNHDEEQFPGALEVRLDRTPNHHLAFGAGIHRCAGIHLARLEMRIVLSEVLDRLRDVRIDHERAEQYQDQGNVAGWLTIPATFTAAR